MIQKKLVLATFKEVRFSEHIQLLSSGPAGHVWVAGIVDLEIKECWPRRPTVKNVVLAEANDFEHSFTHFTATAD